MAELSFASRIYGSAWSDEEVRTQFSDQERTSEWLEILATLAAVQGEFGLIPEAAARGVVATLQDMSVDDDLLREFAAGYSDTSHSTAGLIEAVQRRCPPNVSEWVYYGATVQDLTDTWTAIVLGRCGRIIRQRLKVAMQHTGRLAETHRSSVMPGRTHGQLGLPITFGFKAAGWLDELLRHDERLLAVAERMRSGQLCGGVGSLSSLGPNALLIQAEFLKRLGLASPNTSWTSSRDVVVEWACVLAMLCSCAERIGHEVFNLQRTEIDELRESATSRTIGSITMPHKRNPELSEHLGSLAKVVRMNASALVDSLPHSHERDGRGWKLEWHSVPELTMAAARCVSLLSDMLAGLNVRQEQMKANLEKSGYFFASEALMLELAGHLGKQSAHKLVHGLARQAREQDVSLKEAAFQSADILNVLSTGELERVFSLTNCIGSCEQLVDKVLAVARQQGAL